MDETCPPVARFDTDEETRIELNVPGIGDVIITAYAVAGVRKQHPTRRIVFDVLEPGKINLQYAPTDVANWARLFLDADEIKTHPEKGRTRSPITGTNEWQLRTRHEWLAHLLNTTPSTPRMVDVPAYNWPFKFKRPPVIVAPQSMALDRMYPHWIEVAQALADANWPIVFLGKSLPFRHLETKTPLEMCSAISSAAMVLCADTGPAHVAGVLGVPAITINSVHGGGHIFDFYKCVDSLQANHDGIKPGCSPCHYTNDWEAACRTNGCKAMANTPATKLIDYALKSLDVLRLKHLHPNARALVAA